MMALEAADAEACGSPRLVRMVRGVFCLAQPQLLPRVLAHHLLSRAIMRRSLAKFQGPEIWRWAREAVGNIGQDHAPINCR
jgi:hypothetical protein